MDVESLFDALEAAKRMMHYNLDRSMFVCNGAFADMTAACIGMLSVAENEAKASLRTSQPDERVANYRRAMLVFELIHWNQSVQLKTMKKLKERGAL